MMTTLKKTRHNQKPLRNHVGPRLNHFEKNINTEFNPRFPLPGEYKKNEETLEKSRGDFLSQLNNQAQHDDKNNCFR